MAKKNSAHCQTRKESTKRDRCQTTIDMLPDDALLEVFDCFVNPLNGVEAWFTLMHVCRRWRTVIFGSPHRLKLRLFCTIRTPVRKLLDGWPAIPISIRQFNPPTWDDNIMAALEHSDRVYQVNLWDVADPQLEKVSAAMQRPFPALTDLVLHSNNETAPIIPDSFLGGSAPRLEYLLLNRIPLCGLPKLLLSASGLVNLFLLNIPLSVRISPDTMVTCLSAMPRLRKLQLSFQPPRYHPDRPDPKSQRSPLSTRFVLPALTDFKFEGVGQYLEDLVAQIDAPLNDLSITFPHRPIFDAPQLARFISCTLDLKAPDKARIHFRENNVLVKFCSQTSTSGCEALRLEITCRGSDWPLSSLAQVCASSLPPLPTVEHLYMISSSSSFYLQEIGHTQWLELLRPFAAVRNLYLSEKLAQSIVSALQDFLRQGVTRVLLPTLHNLFLEGSPPSGPVQEAIRQSLAAQQLSSHPIAISQWREHGGW